MEGVRPSIVMWSALAAGIATYETLCPKDELLTDQAHRWIDSKNKLVQFSSYAAIGATALHLARLLPPEIDPYHQIGKHIRRDK